jgi:nucleoside-diphosphate-sugar epimerase
MQATRLEDRIADEEHLDDLLSQPTAVVVKILADMPGDLLILGVNGKMGPSLARMARRASEAAGVDRRIIGVSRFASGDRQARLHSWGIETVRCELLDPQQLEQLPDAPLVVFMVGYKFGATGREALTWAVNSYLPGMICRKYRHSRIVAFSTGNVYGLTPVVHGGSWEDDALNPFGDYAMSCVGRERILEHFSRSLDIPMAILRLNYAVEMRYGVLVDLALRVRDGHAIDLTTGACNVIWQADANAMALAAFAHVGSPPLVLNIAGPEQLSVRRLAEEFGRLLNRVPVFQGTEATDAFLSNGQRGHRLFGYPRVSVEQLIRWTADWVQRGGAHLGKPTHFETRHGKF